jgi:hypothetical protein
MSVTLACCLAHPAAAWGTSVLVGWCGTINGRYGTIGAGHVVSGGNGIIGVIFVILNYCAPCPATAWLRRRACIDWFCAIYYMFVTFTCCSPPLPAAWGRLVFVDG